MRVIKLIISEETLLGDGEDDAYRRQKDIHDIDGNFLYSYDPLEKDIHKEDYKGFLSSL